MSALIVTFLVTSLVLSLTGAFLKDFARFDARQRWVLAPLRSTKPPEAYLNGTLVAVSNIMLGVSALSAIAFAALLMYRLLG